MSSMTAASVSASQAIASSERQSAAAASASASAPSSSRWIFTYEQLMNVPSIREGMPPEEYFLTLKSKNTWNLKMMHACTQELKRRRVAANTIHQMADRLNHESRVRISQLCICAAMMHMHRFFVFHSFFKFDPRDIAAACLFLAGKSEECPRKLDHVVRVWWAIKFPHSPNMENSRLHDASQLIVTLENLVLQTIAFDLSVDIPHPYVLTHMQKFARDASGNRRISEIAYWFASDMLHMTNWGVRYTAKAIACVCIQMACLWAEFEIQTTPDEAPWYKQVDSTMTLDKLLKLTEEFSHIYKTHGESLNIKKYAMRSSLRESAPQQNASQAQQPQQQQQRSGQNPASLSIATLPPPPVAPQLNPAATIKTEPARRIDLNDYKLRNSAAQHQQPNASQGTTSQNPQRRNFMRPDVPPQTVSKGLDLPLPPIIANEKQQNQNKTEQSTPKTGEALKLAAHPIKSGTPKPVSSHKPTTNAAKPLQPGKQPVSGGEQERHKRSRPDDYEKEKEAKHRRIDKMGIEGSHYRKRPHENSAPVGQPEVNASSSAATPTGTVLSNVTQASKSGTPKPTERHNTATSHASHVSSSSSTITASRLRDEVSSQSSKRESSISGNNNTKQLRDESMPSRQRDDSTTPKRSRQAASLNALLPTPPPTNSASLMSASSQNSKFTSSALQPSRSTNYSGESAHRANTGSNWSATNDYHSGSASNPAARFSQPSGSSSHRHYSSSNAGRTKSREPLLSTPDTGNSAYYKRSRPRPSSPNSLPSSSNSYRALHRPPSPVNRPSSNYSSSATRLLSALPPPPPPPPNDELEDGEVL